MFYVFSQPNDLNLRDNLSQQFKRKWCDAKEIDRISGEAETCPTCGRYVSSTEWMSPRKIKLTGHNYPDRLTSWLSEPLVVSERFVNLYKSSPLIGVSEFAPIDFVIVSQSTSRMDSIPHYYCAKTKYTTGVKIDPIHSEIYGQAYGWTCNTCNPFGTTVDRINSIVLDTEHWNGEDIFRVYGLGIVVSQRFYDFVTEHRFTNFDLTEVRKYKIE